MTAVRLRFVWAILLAISFACSKSDPEPGFQNPCTSSAEITDTTTPFGAEIEERSWVPDNEPSASFYNGVLSINGGDDLTQIGNKYIVDIDIANPVVDYNNVSLGTGNALMLQYFDDASDYRGFVDCGFVKIETLDTINGFVSGYFHGTVNDRTSNVFIDISDGVFNLPITSLFCEVPYQQEPVDVDLFNRWFLLGFFDSQGLPISHPPCDAAASIQFIVEDEDTTPIYEVNGFGTVNRFSADLDVGDGAVSISSLLQTEAAGPAHEMDFEEQYFDLLTSAELQYEIEDNLLELTNSVEGVVMRFVLQE